MKSESRSGGRRIGAWGRSLGAALMLAGSACCAGCAMVGMMAASAERQGSTTFQPEYSGLEGRTYAVVAIAQRSVQSEFPALQPSLIQRIDARLAAESGASGHVPGDQVTGFLANNPQWVAWPRSRLADELEVDRLVFIEVNEFRTNEPGNEYLWDGLAWVSVSVIERGGNTDAEAFRKEIRVKFPDQSGVGPDLIDKQGVASALLKRAVDRVCWLFYTHDEPNAITY